jgi:hypothetical protein
VRTLLLYREDGPPARALGRANPLPASLLTLAAVLPLAIAIAAGERGDGVVAAVLAWFVLVGGLGRGGNLERDRFAWTIPSLLRAGEYAALVWLAPAAGLTLAVVLAVHHYDLVYRLRYHPPAPERLGGGWDTRVLIVLVLALLQVAATGFYVLAGILGALFLAEAVASWTRKDDTQGDAA